MGTDITMAEDESERGSVSTGSFDARMEDPNVRLRGFPNPVKAGTNSVSIQFNVPTRLEGSSVRLQVFDVSGRMVRNVLDEVRPAGLHTTSWDLRGESGGSVPSGIYFYRLQVGAEQKIQRILVMAK
jgi:flagellar hook assembly protein FlgD